MGDIMTSWKSCSTVIIDFNLDRKESVFFIRKTFRWRVFFSKWLGLSHTRTVCWQVSWHKSEISFLIHSLANGSSVFCSYECWDFLWLGDYYNTRALGRRCWLFLKLQIYALILANYWVSVTAERAAGAQKPDFRKFAKQVARSWVYTSH